MSQAIEFWIEVEVVPKQADRSRIVTCGNGAQFIQHYQPAAVRNNAFALAALAGSHRPPAPFDGPVRVELEVHHPFPASTSQRQRARGRIPRDTKPDADNLQKQILDALSTVGFWVNDSRIVDVRLMKFWSDKARLRVRVEPVAEEVPCQA